METPNLPAIRTTSCLEQRPEPWPKQTTQAQTRLAIRVRRELAEKHRDLAHSNLAIDRKLRGCDLVKMKVINVVASGQIMKRASQRQTKTQTAVLFESSQGILSEGRRFRVLCVIDDVSRECLTIVVETSLSGILGAREWDRIAEG